LSKSRARARVKGISIESQRACKAGGFGEKPAMEACLQKQAIRRKPPALQARCDKIENCLITFSIKLLHFLLSSYLTFAQRKCAHKISFYCHVASPDGNNHFTLKTDV
jgi:hypothetical protein